MGAFGMTMIMVSKDDLKILEDAVDTIDEAVYCGAVSDEEGGIIRTDLDKFRTRITVALGES